jgi:signal transduction histidine kinase
LLPPATISLIQTVSFLVVGYFINVLVTRLQQQQTALEEANKRLVDYAGTLEELTLSRERNRLARELHDTLAHTLSALSVQLETAKAYWEVDPAAAQAMLDTSLNATRAGLQETRRALKALRATPLEDLGLLLALRELAEESAARANARLQLTLPGTLSPLSPAVEQTLYRIAQEALANARHHANAQTLTVALTVEGDRLSLRVQDDGIGFTSSAPHTDGHFGLSGMRERARLVDGDLRIASQPDEGTTIVFTVEAKR